MESFKTFTKAAERNSEEFEDVILDLPTKDKQSHGGEPDLVTELLKDRISALEKQLIDNDVSVLQDRAMSYTAKKKTPAKQSYSDR